MRDFAVRNDKSNVKLCCLVDYDSYVCGIFYLLGRTKRLILSEEAFKVVANLDFDLSIIPF